MFAEAITKICTPVMMIVFGLVVLVILIIAIPVWLIARWRYKRANG